LSLLIKWLIYLTISAFGPTGEAAYEMGTGTDAAIKLAKISGTATGLITGDVQTASNSANIAAENNLVQFLPAAMLAEAYLISQVDKNTNIVEALENVGARKDDLGKFIDNTTEKGIKWSYKKFPEKTEAFLSAIEKAGDIAGVVVTYLDAKTGKKVSTNWNSLDSKTQNKIKGAGNLLGVSVTGGAVSKALSGANKATVIAKAIAPTEVKQGTVKVSWSKGIMGQGMPWEDYLARKLPEGSRLPAEFNTFDYFDEISGVAINAQTVDTMTLSKIKNPKQIYTTMKNYVDKTVNFAGDVKGTEKVTSDMVLHKRIDLAIPHKTNMEQYKQIEKAAKYAKDNGVELKVTRIK